MSSEFRVQSSELNQKLETRNPKAETGFKKATKEFEAFFLSYMLKTMRETVPKDGLLSGGKGEEIYTSMLDDALSKEMSERGGIGIGELMLKQMEPKNETSMRMKKSQCRGGPLWPPE